MSNLTPQQSLFLSSLGEMAAFLETHPDLIPEHSGVMVNWWGNEAAAKARELGTFKKRSSGELLILSRAFGPHSIELNVYKEDNCTKRVVGVQKKMVTEIIAPAVTRQVEQEVEIVEWDCNPVLPKTREVVEA